MASPKKRKRLSRPRYVLAFLAGLMLPAVLVAGWHAAYGQQAATSRATLASYDADQQRPPVSPQSEAAQMRAVFQKSVQNVTLDRIERYKKLWDKAPKLQQVMEDRRQRLMRLDKAYFDFVQRDAMSQLARMGVKLTRSQYFVYADRNPLSQVIVVGFYDADQDSVEFLGADLISSGNLDKGGDYFVTPTGVFENMVENFSYRAMGTPNQEGWRGLGAKDSRVWDFGDQRSIKKYKDGTTLSQMRLLMHSTDPDKGEPRLGRTDSKGCVRISSALNRFLDTYAILDSNYEEWAKTKPDSWLLKKDRMPVAYPGKYLIVGDSSAVRQAASRTQP